MTVSGGSASVQIQEIDLSTRVPGFPGVYGAICLPARKGPIDVPRLMTYETQLMRTYTPQDRIEVGDSLAFFSAMAFLQRSDKLWVQRVIGDNHRSGGIVIRPSVLQAICLGSPVWKILPHTLSSNDLFTLYQADLVCGRAMFVSVSLSREKEKISSSTTQIS